MSQNVRAIVFALVWIWVGSVLSPGLTPVWEREGSSMDPNGQPRNNSWSAPTTDEGSQMDPNGRQ